MKKIVFLAGALLASVLVWQGCSKSSDTPSGEGGGDASSGRPSAAPAEPVKLAIKWPLNARYVHRMDLTQQSLMRLPQRPDPINQDTTLAQEYAVTVLADRQPAGKELELEYLSAELEVLINKKPMFSFDSGGESLDSGNNPLSAVFRGMVGARIKLFLDGQMEVEKVEGMQALVAKLIKDSPPNARTVVTNMFSEQTFKQMVEFGQGLPENPVKPGDTWSATHDIAMGPVGKLVIEMNYQFEDWEMRQKRLCARLGFAGTMKSQGGPGQGPMGMQMEVEKGDMNGQTWFDPDLGMPVESHILQNLDMILTAQIPRLGDQGGGAQKITSQLKQDIRIRMMELSGQ